MSNLRPGEKHGVSSACAACDEVFCGVEAFDAHRLGDFSQSFGWDGKGRRCLSADEMACRGFRRCEIERWKRPATVRTRAESAVAA